MIYSIEENENVIQIFDPYYVDKYRYIYKIVYENKIYPLQCEFKINNSNKNSKKLKFKLLKFNKNSNDDNITYELGSVHIVENSKKYKKNVSIFWKRIPRVFIL